MSGKAPFIARNVSAKKSMESGGEATRMPPPRMDRSASCCSGVFPLWAAIALGFTDIRRAPGIRVWRLAFFIQKNPPAGPRGPGGRLLPLLSP